MFHSLVEILKERSSDSDKGVTFIESSDKEDVLSYKELYAQALKVLAFLQERGLKPGDELVFQIDENKSFVIVFWASVLGGIIPVPLTVGKNDDHRQKFFNVWEILNNPYLIISSESFDKLQKHAELNENEIFFNSILEKVLLIESMYDSEQTGLIHQPDENDIAYVQFSSGSTGNPKGVTLTHKNLIVNMRGISEASLYTEHDSKLSWMPLTHDMGLIGFHLCPMFSGMHHFLLPTNLFIRKPSIWLEKASQHRTTILCSPNFGYKYLLMHFNSKNNYNWNLSNVRIIYNGAEPISAEICHEFLNSLEQFGLKQTSMYPVYGLAEASLAVSFSKLKEEVISLNIDRTKTNIGSTIAIKQKSESTVSFVNVGESIPYCSIQIADDNNMACMKDVIGHILIKGDNVTSGYYNNLEATIKAITKDGWLDTGDLGFMHNGCLYVTGRSKDIIFVNGQNYYPHDIERSLEIIENIELGKVVISGCTNEKSGEEEIFVFILHKGKIERFIKIYDKVKKHINHTFGFEPDYIIPVREIPKTTSGKIQRFKLIQGYTSGTFNEIIQEIKDLIALQQSGDGYVEPANETEHKITKIWSKVLSHEDFGVTQKFFEIGGNSLKGVQVLTAIHQEFNVELNYNLLYEKQTIQELAIEIIQHESSQYEAIFAINKQDSYPLSSAQKRLYYLWEADKKSIAYNIPVVFKIFGKLDLKQFEVALNKIIQRHEILRSCFFQINGEPKQVIQPIITFELPVTKIKLGNLNKELRKRILPFNLSDTPLFRIEILELSEHEHILFFDLHHIIFDGVSISLFLDEIFKSYNNETLPHLDIHFKDYIHWENKNIESEIIKKQGEYWGQQFKDEVPVLNLPTDFSRPSLMEFRGEKLEFEISEALLTKLKRLAKQENSSMFVLLLAAYNLLLSKYTGQEDIVVGVPVAGRTHQQLQYLIGMFVNNIAIRSFPKGSSTFINFLNQVQSTSLQGLSNQKYPFEKLVRQINQKRDVSRNSLFDTMFIYQNLEFPKCQKDGLSIEHCFFDPGFSKYDISLEVFDLKEGFKFYIEYSTALFRKDTIVRFANHFTNLLNTIVETPNIRLSDAAIINEVEYDNLIIEFNETKCNYPKNKVIHQLIEEQAKINPDAIAVVTGNTSYTLQVTNHRNETEGIKQSTENTDSDIFSFVPIKNLTYKQLNEKSNQLANYLRKKGIAPDIPVAIIMDRCPELIITILGILKAGGCYLPIDKDLPEERVKYILSDSKSNIVITNEDSLNCINKIAFTFKIQCINISNQELYNLESTTITNINVPNNLAYIIYTSGTTGNPKGVMVEHQSLINYISFATNTYMKGERLSFPLYSSLSFDLTVTSIFATLLSGNTIVTYQDNEESLPLEDVINDNQVHILKATPSHLKMLKEYWTLKERNYLSNIKRLVVGGETLSSKLAEDIYKLFDGKVEIYNEYGPTEATVGCMKYKYDIDKDKRQTVPIGIPADNSQIYLLDQNLKPVPVGIVGEIYISGDCLARGYLFNPQLTEKKFIDNTFIPNQKMYKTGDMARKLPDGNIEFVGRIDQQVKINGHRIEIEEIEQHILKHENVKEAVVVLGNDLALSAYVSLDKKDEGKNDVNNQISSIQHLLNVHLPSYMIPKYIIPIDIIPLTKNGKINYSLLPEPQKVESAKKEAANDIQKTMVSVWQDVLNETKIGITDNFFELGGDSINAVQIASRLFDMNISVIVKDILTYQTIEQLCLRAGYTDNVNQYDQGIIEGELELNPIQSWFVAQDLKKPGYYTQSVLLKLNASSIHVTDLKKSFNTVIKHHDGLRLNYNPSKNILFFNNKHFNSDFEIQEYEVIENDDEVCRVDNNSNSFKTTIDSICTEIKESFDIETGLLLKAAIIKDNTNTYLFIAANHLVVDGVSWRIILEDILKSYKSHRLKSEVQLSHKTGSLLDWMNGLKGYINEDNSIESDLHWEVVEAESFNIPIDNEIDAWLQVDMVERSFYLSEEQTTFLLKKSHEAYKTDVPTLLNVALAQTLQDWTKSNKFIIEQESHGRHLENIDVSRTVGWFTCIYPVLLELSSSDIASNIKEIKEQLRQVPNDGLDYGLRNFLNKIGENANVTISEIRLNYLGIFGKELENDLFSYSNKSTGFDSAPENRMTVKLEINCMVVNNQLIVKIFYNNAAHKDSTILWFMETFKEKLDSTLLHIRRAKDICFTSSDFDATIDQEDLDALFN